MTKKGYGIIYIIVLSLPLIFILYKVIDLVIVYYKINTNIVYKQQALYNSEAGIEFGIKKIKDYEMLNPCSKTYYMIINDDLTEFYDKKIEFENGAVIDIKFSILDKNIQYTIDSLGKYKNFEYRIKRILTKPIKAD